MYAKLREMWGLVKRWWLILERWVA